MKNNCFRSSNNRAAAAFVNIACWKFPTEASCYRSDALSRALW